MNRLAEEKAAYLRHAAHQRIDWYPWSDDAFEKARREDKPVFLSSGAIWCHWCHVMAKECFEDEEIIRLLNEDFVCVKLDRDERPDIDRRYQQAVAAMGSGGGWPLSVFLTPDRKAFYGGTYFPPEDRYGRPGFRKILSAVSDAYRSKKDEISAYTERLASMFSHHPVLLGDVGPSDLDDAEHAINSHFDPQNGGFGSAPKFPMPGALDFLIKRSFFSTTQTSRHSVIKTLEAMAKGGFHDQIGGGFHRYSTDEAWIIPHFEKMADDNAWLLKNYVDGYALSGNAYFRTVAEGIMRFARQVLSDPEGGFYASQDADVTPDDEGGYFTWSEKDFRRVLDDEEFQVLSTHLFHERGAMHHDESKNVVFVSQEPEAIAEKTGKSVGEVLAIIERSKEKLLQERSRREEPFIDKTIYTSLNGMFIAAFLKASRVLGDRDAADFALRSMDRLLRERLIGGCLYHSEDVKAFLDDYVSFIEALLSAYEMTGKRFYLTRAEELCGRCIEGFWDEKGGGFFDTEEEVLGRRIKGIEDVPHPSANAVGILQLDRIHALTGKDSYRQYALKALRSFILNAREFGLHAGSYYAALDAHFHSLALRVHAPSDSQLAEAARAVFYPALHVLYEEGGGYIVPCSQGKCYEPIENPADLKTFVANFGRG